ncbi:MAG: hypothetical protein RI900_2343, partial [Actinomycetota bacterium]
PDDTLETLTARVHAVEHHLLVRTLGELCPAPLFPRPDPVPGGRP